MSFELDAKVGCVNEGSPSLLHEAMDHVRNTWSKVLSGKGSTQDYAEAAVEATAVVAASAFAFKGGMKLFSVESRVGSRVADPELLAAIRNAAKGNPGGLGRKLALGPDGLPYVTAESRFGSRVVDPKLFAKIQDAAKGDLKNFGKKPPGYDARPIDAVDSSLPLKKGLDAAGAAGAGLAKGLETLTAKDFGLASFKPDFGSKGAAFALRAAEIKSISPLSTSAGIPPYVHKVGAIEKFPLSKPGPVAEVIGIDLRQRPINVRIVSK